MVNLAEKIVYAKDCCMVCRFSEDTASDELYECHRYPPPADFDTSGEPLFRWPVVFNTSWCGEFVRREGE